MSLEKYKVISIDPSYRRTGVFTDFAVGTPFLFREGYYSSLVKDKLGPLEFSNLVQVAMFIRDSFVSIYGGVRYRNAVMEYPPPRGSMSPALFALDTLILEELIKISDCIYLVPCNAIKSFLKNQNSKTDIVNFVKGKNKCWGLNHDEASAVVLYEVVLAKLRGEYSGIIYKLKNGNYERL